MGSGNFSRRLGQSKKGLREQGIENIPVSVAPQNQRKRREDLDTGLESDGSEEYETGPRPKREKGLKDRPLKLVVHPEGLENIQPEEPEKNIPAKSEMEEGEKDLSAASYHEGPKIEASPMVPIAAEKETKTDSQEQESEPDTYEAEREMLTPGERESIATMAWASVANDSKRPSRDGKYMYRSGPTPETAGRKPIVVEKEEKKETPEKKEPGEQDRKKKMVFDSVRLFLNDALKSGDKKMYAETILRRLPESKDLSDEDVKKILEEIKKDREKITKEITEFIFEKLSSPYVEKEVYFEEELDKKPKYKRRLFTKDIVDNEVFMRLRDEIKGYGEEYLKNKKASEKKPVEAGKREETQEKPFTPEQMNELRDLLAVAKKFAGRAEQSELRKAVEGLITEELIPEGLFVSNDIPKAADYVMKWVEKLSPKK